VSWFAFFFPQTFMSHFGFYWALSTISIVMRQLLVRYNYGHHYGQMPGARSWCGARLRARARLPDLWIEVQARADVGAVPLVRRPPRRRDDARDAAARRRVRGEQRPRHAAVGNGARLPRHERGERRKFLRVVHEQTTIGFVSADAATIKAKPRTFETEAQFTTELEAFFRAAFARKVGVPRASPTSARLLR